jgi:hypothetical protein
MKPTVGRIVHYTNLGDKDGKYPPEQQAAIITGVKDRVFPEDQEIVPDPSNPLAYVVDLHIFYRTGDFFMLDVPFSQEYARGHWSWPKREE